MRQGDGLTIGELDGYVAGLIVCPEPVLPAEWLPTLWGGENGFAELDGVDQIAAAVLDHYNRIARELAEEEASEIDRTAPDLIHSILRCTLRRLGGTGR